MKAITSVLSIAAIGLLPAVTHLSAADARSYAATRFGLSIDGGKETTLLRSFEGGGATASVVEESAGWGSRHKHISEPRFDNLVFELPGIPQPGLQNWIAGAVRGDFQAQEGAVQVADYSGKEVARLAFTEALITEVTIPACDASSKAPGALAITVSPGLVQYQKASAKSSVPFSTKQKLWSPANFRLNLPGVDCSRVLRIEELKITQNVVEEPGAHRESFVSPGKLEYPNLRLTISATSLDSWRNWYEAFMVQGNNGEEHELNGSIEFLSTDQSSVVMAIDMKGVGMSKFKPFVRSTSADTVSRFEVELYVEDMKLGFPE